MIKNPQYDFNAPINKTTSEIAKVFLHELSANADELIVVETAEANDEKATDFAIKMMRIISSTDIPADYASYSIDKIILILQVLKKYIDGTLDQVKTEILSRYIGVRSPKTGTYTYDCATVGDFMMTLDRVRKETGGDENDFFVKPDPTPEPDGTRGVVNNEVDNSTASGTSTPDKLDEF